MGYVLAEPRIVSHLNFALVCGTKKNHFVFWLLV